LDKTSKDDAQRLRTTLNTTQHHSSLTVAVLGCGRKDAEEVEMLRHLTDMDARLEVGASVWSVDLEERIRLQSETQYPKAIEKLLASLTETTARLDEASEQSPFGARECVLFIGTPFSNLYTATRWFLQIQQTFELEKPKLMNELREVLADMTMQIKNYMVQAHNWKVSPIDDFDDPLECGKTKSQSARKGITGYSGAEKP
jgi:hypothetical protein